MAESRPVGINLGVAVLSPTRGATFAGRMFWIHILQNAAGRLYIGPTDDLQTRMENPNRTGKIDGKFTCQKTGLRNRILKSLAISANSDDDRIVRWIAC